MAEFKGRGSQIASQEIAKEVKEGNDRDRVAGKDRYGRPLLRLRSKRKGKYAGKTGPPLAPSGAASRVVTSFRAGARRRAGRWQVVAGWENVTSESGVPFLPFHAEGRGRLPIRDIFGISPGTWAKIRPVVDRFMARITKVKA